MADQPPLLFPNSWKWGERPHAGEAVCATANKNRTLFCLRLAGHKGKHSNANLDRW